MVTSHNGNYLTTNQDAPILVVLNVLHAVVERIELLLHDSSIAKMLRAKADGMLTEIHQRYRQTLIAFHILQVNAHVLQLLAAAAALHSITQYVSHVSVDNFLKAISATRAMANNLLQV